MLGVFLDFSFQKTNMCIHEENTYFFAHMSVKALADISAKNVSFFSAHIT